MYDLNRVMSYKESKFFTKIDPEAISTERDTEHAASTVPQHLAIALEVQENRDVVGSVPSIESGHSSYHDSGRDTNTLAVGKCVL